MLFSSESPDDEEPVEVIGEPSTTWRFIPIKESKVIVSSMKVRAPGPDGYKVCDLKSMDAAACNFVLNFCLFRRKTLRLHKVNRTILIPKTNDGRENASNWRPITISSVFVRALNKLMAARLNGVITLNVRQKAFVPVDGCLENTLLLDFLIKEARRGGKNLNLLGIDLAKAFDSVSHRTIRRAMNRAQIDSGTIEYVLESYQDSTTTIVCGSVRVEDVKLIRGVKQGDPLSPLLFNLIIDELLSKLPDELGVRLEGSFCNALGFADDLIVVSDNLNAAKDLLARTETFFQARSMRINARKCFSLTLKRSLRNRSVICETDSMFKIAGTEVTPCTSYNFFTRPRGNLL